MRVKNLVHATISLASVYLIGAFISWSFNPGNWIENYRIMTAVCGPMIALFFYVEGYNA